MKEPQSNRRRPRFLNTVWSTALSKSGQELTAPSTACAFHEFQLPRRSPVGCKLHFCKSLQAKGSDWARLFLVPGMTHCGGGPSLDNFDALGALVNWVEQGNSPERIEAKGSVFPGVSRPLCPFPEIPRYKGTGSTDDAANFACQASR